MSCKIRYNGSQIAELTSEGAKTIKTGGKYVPYDISVEYSGGGETQLQSKVVSPTTQKQTITPDAGFDGLSSVEVNAMPSGSAGTPSATKGSVSNHQVSVTPKVTNTTGYITGGTKTGNAVTVAASELVSGTFSAISNGTYDVTNYESVEVNVSGGGGGNVEVPFVAKGVNFVDFDGRIVAAWPANEVASKNALPANPDHTNDVQWGGHTIALSSLGWNWTLANIKTYISKYPNSALCVGQTYCPTDGKLHICVTLTAGRLNPSVTLTVTSGSASIDWGDGSAVQSFTSAKDNAHVYAVPGNYDITVIPNTSSTKFNIVGTTRGSELCQKPGNTVANNEHSYQGAIKRIFVPVNCTLGNYAFYYCTAMESVTIPNGVTSLQTSALYYCYCLKSLVIPSTVTSIGNSPLRNANGLKYVSFPSGLTSIGTYSLGGILALISFAIPEGLTSISDSMFNGDYNLTSVTIPSTVTTIGASVFNNCYGLGEVWFTKSTPPTISNSNTWTNVPADCIIRVPSGSLSAYISATNYPDSATYTYAEY